MSNKGVEVYAQALKRKEEETNLARNSTSNSTQVRDLSRDLSRHQPRDLSRDKSRHQPRDGSRENSREISHDQPTRDDIQEFSFQLRDTLKVKVQAEVPHEWQKELDEMASELNVKKLELYRYIYGAFLGKVRDKQKP